MVRVVKHVEGSYETQDVEFGTVYRWCLDCVVVECDCSERSILAASSTTCDECGADHAAMVREELATRSQNKGEVPRPWRYDCSSEDIGLPF